MQETIKRITSNEPNVYAFEISGEIREEDMKSMATTMQSAFAAHESVDMLLIFRDYQGSETGAGMNEETIRSQWQALSQVKRYAVVGAPDYAKTLIDVMDKLIPVKAETFPAEKIDEAWAFVGARPVSD